MSEHELADQETDSDIAIVGMAGRFPQARSLEEFWRNLHDGVESVITLTDEELSASGATPALLSNPNFVKRSVFLDDVELFDAPFFGYNPREASIIDPQQRFFLECAWEALEAAGYDPARYHGAIGVFAGVSISTYLINLYANRALLGPITNFQLVMSNDKDHLPTRVSYKLDLRGPSVNVQTSCSTSLVAVHLACQSLLGGESDMALAGGTSIPIPQRRGYLYQEGNIVSPDGHCRAFDADAAGTVDGDGVGLVVLKRLADALSDGDQIYAVIKGSAINNDGALKVGYTAPSVEGQAKVIAEAQAVAGVEADSITYVEAHGTGTSLGDPIEIAALTKAFGASTPRKNYCAVGSVKTNIGHLDAAAGVAGLIKTALALKHKQLPPSLHFKQPNPKIDFARSPFFINASLREWEAGATPRRAGVSSFGIGGTNAHVILEEAPAIRESGDSRPWQLLLLSARTETALEKMTDGVMNYLQRNAGVNLADVCYTLQVGRKTFDQRRALVCRDVADAWGALAARNTSRVMTRAGKPRARSIVFMFSGQGAQRIRMGQGLYLHETAFREQVDRCAEILAPHLGFDVRDALYPTDDQSTSAALRLSQTSVTQPALFVTEYALARLWMTWGVRPAAMIGHSLGEYVAACLAGVFSLEEALSLVAARGRLMQGLLSGAMLAVPFGEDEARLVARGGDLSVASVNGPRACVISGAMREVETLERRLNADGVASRRLQTSHAFHSAMTEPILEAFTWQVAQVKLHAPNIPYVSNLTGDWIKAEEATDPRYWAQHLRETVRFHDGLSRLLAEPDHVFVEVGPGQTLCTLLKRHPDKQVDHLALPSLPAAEGGADEEQASLLKTAGQLWQAGVEIDWTGFHAGERRRRIELPTYPFERERCWIGFEGAKASPSPIDEAAAAREVETSPAIMHQTVTPEAQPSSESTLESHPLESHVAPPRVAATANGDPHHTAAAAIKRVAPVAQTASARLVGQQLEIMMRQLEVLRRRR